MDGWWMLYLAIYASLDAASLQISHWASLSIIWDLNFKRTLKLAKNNRCWTHQRLSSGFEIFLTNFKLGVEQPYFSKRKLKPKTTQKFISTLQLIKRDHFNEILEEEDLNLSELESEKCLEFNGVFSTWKYCSYFSGHTFLSMKEGYVTEVTAVGDELGQR